MTLPLTANLTLKGMTFDTLSKMYEDTQEMHEEQPAKGIKRKDKWATNTDKINATNLKISSDFSARLDSFGQ